MSAPFYADVASAPPPATVAWLTASDGIRLRVARWGTGARPMVAIFPGRTEVIEKYGHTVTALDARGFDVAVIDWRGQGLSDRLCDAPLRGHVRDFADYQKDVQAYWDWLSDQAGPRFVLAHSMGGCIGLRALTNGLSASAVAFSAPMWDLTLARATLKAVPAITGLLGIAGQDTREVPGAGEEFKMWTYPFEHNKLTRDRARYEWAQAQVIAYPELRLCAPSMRWLAAAVEEMDALQTVTAPNMPCLVGIGTGDAIISQQAARNRVSNWPGGDLVEYDRALHELLIERPEVRNDFMSRVTALFQASA